MSAKNLTLGQLLELVKQMITSGQARPAESICQQILLQKPDEPEVVHLHAIAQAALGKVAEANESFSRAVTLRPDYAQWRCEWADALRSENRFEEAAAQYHEALRLQPDFATAYFGLGLVRIVQDRLADARCAFEKVLQLQPDHFAAHNNLANVDLFTGDLETAIRHYERALFIQPASVDAATNLAIALSESGRSTEAQHRLVESVKLSPNSAELHRTLAAHYQRMGRVTEATAELETALRIEPNNATVFSEFVFLSNLDETLDEDQRFQRHEQFAWRFESLSPRPPRIEHQRIRVGFVSADFRTHPVADYLQPVLKDLNRSEFEVFAYSNVSKSDHATEAIKGWCDHWRDISRSSDADAAEMIRRDEIEMLIDLSGHAASNRLPLFLLRPAPVQMTWLGYPNTTGLRAIDFRITDAVADPPGTTEQWHTETMLRMDRPFLCYRPLEQATPSLESPFLKNGFITFGSFATFSKIRQPVINLWADILRAVPNSQLIIKNRMMRDKDLQEQIKRSFADVDPGRVVLMPPDKVSKDHLEHYTNIDIALDTFPYHGTTTTLEALSMGVPTVVLIGKSHLSRVGLTLLKEIGLDDLAVTTREEYLERAKSLAHDHQRLASLRQELPQLLSRSRLMNSINFAEDFAKVLRDALQLVSSK